MRRGPGRYRRMPIACPAARASLFLCGCCQRANTHSHANDKLPLPAHLRRGPHAFRGGSPRSPTPLTFSPPKERGEGNGSKGRRPAWVRALPVAGRPNEPDYKLTLAEGGGFLKHHPAGNHSSAPELIRRVSTGSRKIVYNRKF